MSCSMWSGSVEIFQNESVDWVHTVVNTGGKDVDAESVLDGWVEAELRGAAEDEGADVH